MKKLIPLFLITALGFTGGAMADGFNNNGNVQTNGGFNNNTLTISTVEQAKQMNKDAWVTLQGKIVKQIGEEDYLFRDSTGDINIEIDHKYWQGRTVTPDDIIQITGEVDTHRFKPIDIDVKNLQIISSVK